MAVAVLSAAGRPRAAAARRVRTREGYINVPLGELEKRLNELPKNKTILTA